MSGIETFSLIYQFHERTIYRVREQPILGQYVGLGKLLRESGILNQLLCG